MATGQQFIDAATALRDARAEHLLLREQLRESGLVMRAMEEACDKAREREESAYVAYVKLADETISTRGREFI